jgi:hypothetical protein
MKEHFCSAEQSIIIYQGKCNWCGEQETLAQTQEPVSDDIASILACRDMLDAQPVPPRTWVGSGDLEDSNAYLTPPQRTWVGLTDEERIEIDHLALSRVQAVQMTEAKLKEKNT